MKRLTPTQQACTLALTIASLVGGGCTSTASNTQRGAAGGAALGALAGAIIGNNRGSGNAASGAAIGAAAGAIAGGAMGHAKDKREAASTGSPPVYSADAPSNAMTNIYVDTPPPMPTVTEPESISQRPNARALWVPGYWTYDNGQNYLWVAGHWEIPPAGSTTFRPPEWRRQGNGYVYVRGYWQ
ncbi:MAG TPA: glycine zipper domain-containing protein [Opitutus sp.]|nr:glycine zipper domain-containing protein [Opitutus sp.]